MLLRFSLTLKATPSPAKRTITTKYPCGYPDAAKSSGTLHLGRTSRAGESRCTKIAGRLWPERRNHGARPFAWVPITSSSGYAGTGGGKEPK